MENHRFARSAAVCHATPTPLGSAIVSILDLPTKLWMRTTTETAERISVRKRLEKGYVPTLQSPLYHSPFDASDLRRFCRERFNRITRPIIARCQNRSNLSRGVIGNRVSGRTASPPHAPHDSHLPSVIGLKVFDRWMNSFSKKDVRPYSKAVWKPLLHCSASPLHTPSRQFAQSAEIRVPNLRTALTSPPTRQSAAAELSIFSFHGVHTARVHAILQT